MAAPESIQIRGMTYTVERFVRERHGKSEVAYRLRGTRDAHYETVRNIPKPDMMFLVYVDRIAPAAVLRGVWLTDKDGKLRVVRT